MVTFMEDVKTFSREIAFLKERNSTVDANKAWETSTTYWINNIYKR
jgi:hypothetical protein